MRSRVVAVRCFAEESARGWEAHCVDLGLTVHGGSLDEVRKELDTLIHQLIDDKLVKRRKALRSLAPSPRGPLELRLRYWGLLLAGRLGLRTNALRDGARNYSPRAIPRGAR